MAPLKSRGKGTSVAFLSGGVSAACTTLLFQPLDLVKTRMQVHTLALRSTPVYGYLWVFKKAKKKNRYLQKMVMFEYWFCVLPYVFVCMYSCVCVLWFMSFYLLFRCLYRAATTGGNTVGMLETINTVIRRENFTALWNGTSPVCNTFNMW